MRHRPGVSLIPVRPQAQLVRSGVPGAPRERRGYLGIGLGLAFDGLRGPGTPAPTIALTVSGTATSSITASDIVSGGKTIILTLTNDTWLAA